MDTGTTWSPPTLANAIAAGEFSTATEKTEQYETTDENGETITETRLVPVATIAGMQYKQPVPTDPERLKFRCLKCRVFAWPFQFDDVRGIAGIDVDFLCDGCYEKLKRDLVDVDGDGKPDTIKEWKQRYIALHGGPTEVYDNIGTCFMQEPTLEELRAIKKDELLKKASSALDALVTHYPEVERQSWPKQEKEARAYMADSTADTPFLTKLATERSQTVEQIAVKVIEKADALYNASAVIIGTRKNYETEIENAANYSELNLLSIVF